MRSAKEIYGLPTNASRQQREADQGTLMVRHVKIEEYLSMARWRTLHAGDERSGSAWQLPEIQRDMDQMRGKTVDFHTCAYMEDKFRYLKPARWGGKLDGVESLSKVCKCPPWVKDTFSRKAPRRTSRAYPRLLCAKIAQRSPRVGREHSTSSGGDTRAR